MRRVATDENGQALDTGDSDQALADALAAQMGGDPQAASDTTQATTNTPAADTTQRDTSNPQRRDGIGGDAPATDIPAATVAAATDTSTTPASTAAKTYAPIQGFDTAKLQDPTYVDPKYSDQVRQFASGLGSGVEVGRNNLGGMVSYLQANGYPNAKAVGDDSIDYGDGKGPIDVVQSNGSIWFNNIPSTGASSTAAAPSTAAVKSPIKVGGSISPSDAVSAALNTAYGGTTTGTGAEAGTAATAAADPNASALNTLLSTLIGNQQTAAATAATDATDKATFRKNILDTVDRIITDNSGVPTAEDPIIANQVKAFRGQGESAQRQARAAYAERARAQGLSTGSLDSAVEQGYDTLGRNTGAYSAGLVGSEADKRRANLLSAAQLGAGIQTSDQANTLQNHIADLTSAISAAGKQGDQAIDWATLFQKPQLASISALPGLLSAQNQGTAIGNQDAQFYAGLNQQGSQFDTSQNNAQRNFYDTFGYNVANNDDLQNLLAQYLLKG